ncbi:MAG: hypothetical protein DHS20C18_39000 [Saprospiraceae bacterium]|nr:MAG: hypothetical protein DHS20C18_39000 [Saprospiraceae bacterium]
MLLALFFTSCQPTQSSEPDKQSEEAVKNEETPPIVQENTLMEYPIKIGNHKAVVRIVGWDILENGVSKGRRFKIELTEKGFELLSVDVDKSVLIDNNETVHFLDSLNADYTPQAVIKDITYDFIRGNTLYFKAILENPEQNKEILGRFNLFYGTERKGEIYGWITDEVK